MEHRRRKASQKGRIALVLFYEPSSDAVEPFPVIRVASRHAVIAAAKAAVVEAEARAHAVAGIDRSLSEMGRIDANRLRELFTLVVPEFENSGLNSNSPDVLM